ncbi:hypothetical protein HJFPF1_00260 [Paramyrothecium foliicola]|nr:hypothetical protein HJFPF1_00260 [Paramyrothecium foliicola]
MPETNVVLVTKQELADNITKTHAIPNPEPSGDTKKKNHWIQGIVKNCTQFQLKVRPPPYFNSGRYETWPSDISAWSVSQFSAVNGDNSLAGATGGNAWNLQLEQGLEVNLAFGFTDPVAGKYKSGVVESISAEDGYKKATEGGNKIVSQNEFSGVDTDGNDMNIMFEVQCSGGQKPVYTITQTVY